MMTKLDELKTMFDKNKQARILSFVAAVLLTIPNTSILIAALDGEAWSYVMLVPTAMVTLLLYYLSDGIPVFMVIVKAISAIAHAFGILVTSMLSWMMGLGSLFAIGISFLVKIAFIFGGLMFAYAFPGIFVPIFYLIAKAAHLLTNTGSEEDLEKNVDYDTVYQNVMDEVES